MLKSRKEVEKELLEVTQNELTRLEVMAEFMEKRARRVELTAGGKFTTGGTADVFRRLMKTNEVQIAEKKELIDFLKSL